jgi:hypothetical protein
MDLHPDWREFLQLLNSHDVEFLIVGAHALAFHGYPRMTADLDCYVGNSVENCARLDLALKEFGFRDGVPAEFGDRPRVLMMGRLPFRIDLLNMIDGVTFSEAWAGRVLGEIGGVPVNFLSRADLIRNKTASGRAKDLADIEMLSE